MYIAISKDRIEDERIERIRLYAYSKSFLAASLCFILLRFLNLGREEINAAGILGAALTVCIYNFWKMKLFDEVE